MNNSTYNSTYNKKVHLFGKIAILFMTLIVYPMVGMLLDIQFVFMMLGLGLLLTSGAFYLVKFSSPTPRLDKWLIRIFLVLGLFFFVSSLITVKEKEETINSEFSVTSYVDMKIVTSCVDMKIVGSDTTEMVYNIITVDTSDVIRNSRGIGSTQWYTDLDIDKINLVRVTRKGLYGTIYYLHFEYEGESISKFENSHFHQINR